MRVSGKMWATAAGWATGAIGAGIGFALGHLLDKLDESGEEDCPLQFEDIWVDTREIGPSGPGLKIYAVLRPRELVPADISVGILFTDGNGADVRTDVETYAHEGKLVLLGEVMHEQVDEAGGPGVMAYLPYACLAPEIGTALNASLIAASESAMPELAEGEMPGPDTNVPVLAAASEAIELPDADARIRDNPLFALAAAGVLIGTSSRELGRDVVRAIKQRLRQGLELDEIGLRSLREMLKLLDREGCDRATIVATLRDTLRHAGDQAFLGDYLVWIARVEGGSEQASRTVQDIWDGVGLDPSLLENARSGGAAVAQDFTILELESDATVDEIKAAYRRLAKDYHPDRVATLPKGFQEYAHTRMTAITAAYQAVMKLRGVEV